MTSKFHIEEASCHHFSVFFVAVDNCKKQIEPGDQKDVIISYYYILDVSTKSFAQNSTENEFLSNENLDFECLLFLEPSRTSK